MNLRLVFLASALSVAAAAGCYTGSATDTNRPPGSAVQRDGTEPTDDSGPGPKDAAIAAPTGLPCDVSAVLTSVCTDCHGSVPSGGATNRLLSYEDLAARAESDPSRTVAELALVRMKSTKRPMPPEGNVSEDSVSILESWIAEGLPRGRCGEPPIDDGGSPNVPESGAPIPKADAASVCSSGTFSPPDTFPGLLMKPGQACIACHSKNGPPAPAFEIAGTVYKSKNEPDDCFGLAGVKVLIIDATGTPHTMPTNEAGNFRRVTSFPRPYRAMVIRGTNVREMKTPQMDGDCNGCHTEWGTNGAPGRVMAP